MIFLNYPKRGFSLVEVLVAISLLLLVIVGPMQMLTQTSNSTRYATEQVTAYFLAQEAIELVHKYRDDLLLEYFASEFSAGNSNMSDPMFQLTQGDIQNCYGGTGCGVYLNNTNDVTFTDCNLSNGSNTCQLKLDLSGNIKYTHDVSATEPSPFIRRVEIVRIPNTGDIKEFKITSTVEWRTGSLIGGQRVQLVTYLQNIYDTD